MNLPVAAHPKWVTTRRRPPLTSVERARGATRLAALRAGVNVADPALPMRVLNRAVANIVGPHASPRPGQIALTEDITQVLSANPDADPHVAGGRLIGQAPTGIGKTLSQLAPAAVAALAGRRTVISTESLSLQAQLLDKDGPVVLDACQQVTGVRPTLAVLKGWGNFACAKATVDAAADLTGMRCTSIAEARTAVAPMLAKDRTVGAPGLGTSRVPERSGSGIATLVDWALEESERIELGGTGDINRYPGDLPTGGWARVSVSSADCLGLDCPFADRCLPLAHKAKVATADIVITNHSLLGIQATRHAPIVTGSRSMGTFHNLMVDECHALPGIVRGQGASELSERSVEHLRSSIARVLSGLDGDTELDDLLRTGKAVAAQVGLAIVRLIPPQVRSGFSTAVKLGPGDEPLAGTADLLRSWLGWASKLVAANLAAQPPESRQTLSLKRLASRLHGCEESVDNLAEHKVGVARWAEVDARVGSVLRSSPVDVAPILSGGLWKARCPPNNPAGASDRAADPAAAAAETDGGAGSSVIKAPSHGADADPPDSNGEPSRLTGMCELNVVCLSATVPAGFGAQVGIRAPITTYVSPFEAAYADRTALYVPKVGTADLDQVSKPAGRNRRRFDTTTHPAWAAREMAELVEANRGSALVLSATTKAGQEYTRQLKVAAHGRWEVLSQWDGRAPNRIVADWRGDVTSVLVGTRSMMTGVDAPGGTCTLVVVDRVPRAAGNVVDDARVEALVERLEMDRWSADRLVYYADARTLLAQAGGRLVRSVTDGGMLAVLDPRLLKSSEIAYPEQTRDFLMRALRHFGAKLSDLGAAKTWMASRQVGREAGAA